MINPLPYLGYGIVGFNCDRSHKRQNIVKVLSYTPIVGTVLGIFFAVILISDNDLSKKDQFYMALRAVPLIVGVGFLFIIPDIIATFYTGYQYKKQCSYQPISGYSQ